VTTYEKQVLCRSKIDASFTKIGRFYFNPVAIKSGIQILNNPNISDLELIVIDEIGLFELHGKLWACSLAKERKQY